MRECQSFWIACQKRGTCLDPLTVDVPGLGESLAVFCFEEEAMLYLGYGDEDLRLKRVGPGELVDLLRGFWARFELITLDPMPEDDAGVMLRLASIHRDDFLNYLLGKREPGRQARTGGPQASRERRPLVYAT